MLVNRNLETFPGCTDGVKRRDKDRQWWSVNLYHLDTFILQVLATFVKIKDWCELARLCRVVGQISSHLAATTHAFHEVRTPPTQKVREGCLYGHAFTIVSTSGSFDKINSIDSR
jgi:hypothetical protein